MNKKSKYLTYKRVYELLDEADSLIDSDSETIELIRDELKKKEKLR